MSELPRRMVSQLRRFIGNRRRARRGEARLPFSLSLEDSRGSRNGFRRLPPLQGHTLDLSTTGLALVVPAIRIGGHYLAGTERRLYLKLELPDGPVDLTLIPVRYESLEEDPEETGYVIGSRIEDIRDGDRERYHEYVGNLLKNQRNS
ncbi:MAG TPA: PilZ domain-containing protein [Pyrinomonadaceae bacterium]